MHKIKKSIDSQKLTEVIVEGMKDNKAKDIVILDLRKIDNAVTDFFVICTGDSSTQIDGIGSSVVRLTRKELKERPWHQEGKGVVEWLLLDYVNVVVHIFSEEMRAFYDVEEMWSDAKKTMIPNLD
jgi:ribosome-associated protein